MYFIINFDINPGKMKECDNYIREKLMPYWTSHKEVHSVKVLEDMFIGWPERSLLIEVDDLTSLQRILASKETRQMKEEFTFFATDIQTQVMNIVIHTP